MENVLGKKAKRWKLDEVVTHTGKPSEIYYLLLLRKSVTRDDFITAVRTEAGDTIVVADLESRDPGEQDAKGDT